MSFLQQRQSLAQGNIADVNDRIQSADSRSVFFRPGVEVLNYKPTWNDAKRVFLFQPVGLLGDDGVPKPAFEEFVPGDPKPTNWYYKLPIASYVGSAERISFPLFDPILQATGQYDAGHNPYIVLWEYVRRLAGKPGGEVYKGMISRDNRDRVLSETAWNYFFQGFIYQTSKRLSIDKGGVPKGLRQNDTSLPIVQVSAGGGKAIIAAVHSVLQAENPQEAEDMLSGRSQRLIAIMNSQVAGGRGQVDYTQVQQLEAGSLSDLSTSSAADESAAGGAPALQFMQLDGDDSVFDSGGSDFAKWEAFSPVKPYISIQLKQQTRHYSIAGVNWLDHPQIRSMVVKRYRPFAELLAVPSHEEQIDMLCKAFADKRELLGGAFPEGSEYYTESVRRLMTTKQISFASLSDDAPKSQAPGGGLGHIEGLDQLPGQQRQPNNPLQSLSPGAAAFSNAAMTGQPQQPDQVAQQLAGRVNGQQGQAGSQNLASMLGG